ncbi:MAG: hypothetical protein JXC85_04820 [Candidatus Aenigmarchaeota archaeon]|nr:hypothetical protein [Candidatus Aenigmarchaeota archaeon]
MGKAKEFLLGMKEGGSDFGFGVSGVVNFILLSFVYVFGVGLTSAAARLKGKHFLSMGIDKGAETYFVNEPIKKKDKEEYFRQF